MDNMNPHKIQSKAFALATLRSEKVRIIGLIVVSFVLFVILVLRGWVGNSDDRYWIYRDQLALYKTS